MGTFPGCIFRNPISFFELFLGYALFMVPFKAFLCDKLCTICVIWGLEGSCCLHLEDNLWIDTKAMFVWFVKSFLTLV